MVKWGNRLPRPGRAGRAAHYASYIAVGACTTAVNALAYLALRLFGSLPAVLSNFAAWTVSVAFAYFANRRLVFGSAARGARERFLEAGSFLSSRALSLVLDMGLMWAGLRAMGFTRPAAIPDPAGELALKIAVNAVVVAVNYLTGKLVFRFRWRNP